MYTHRVLLLSCFRLACLAFLLNSGILSKNSFAQDAEEVKPTCCIAIIDSSDPSLAADANQWFDGKPDCGYKLSFSSEEVDAGAVAASKKDCGKLEIGYFKHGSEGKCEQMVEEVAVCAEYYPDCDINATSMACSTFSSQSSALAAMNNSNLAELSKGRTIKITGEQSNSFFISPNCSIKRTYELKNKALSCSWGACAEPGTPCSPINSSSICTLASGQRANQMCCAVKLGSPDSYAYSTRYGTFANPNESCPKDETPSCIDDINPNDAVDRNENFANSFWGRKRCPGAFQNLTTSIQTSVVSKCSGKKCEYYCDQGFKKTDWDECKNDYQCQGEDKNIVKCTGYGVKLTADRGLTLVEDKTKCNLKFDHCTATCKKGYHIEKNACVKDYACLQHVPKSSKLCDGDDDNLTSDVARSPVMSCSDDKKCEYQCKEGYYLTANGLDCFKPKCIGKIPKHSVFCKGSDEGLSVDTPRVLSRRCTVFQNQCEYTCNDSSTYDPTTQKCIPIEYDHPGGGSAWGAPVIGNPGTGPGAKGCDWEGWCR